MIISKKEIGQVTGLLFLLALIWLTPVLFPPSGQAVGGLDSRGQFYIWFQIAREAVFNGRWPYWNGALFAGYPFLSDPQIAFFYPVTWLILLLPPEAAISWHILLHIVIAGAGMYVLVRVLNGHPIGAYAAAITFAFSGYVAARVYAGHIGFIATNSWLPWMLVATVWSSRRQTIWAAILSGVPFGLAILAGNPTSLLYSVVIWTAFTIYWQLQDKSRTWIGRQFLIALVIGIMLSFVQLLPFIQFSLLSSRAAEPSFEFSTQFSFPPAHLITLLIPEFFGEPTRAGYWSVPNFEELTYYAGVVPLLGLIFALKRPSRLVWFYIGLIIVGLLLAVGSYGFLYRWFFTLLPPFRLVRAPGRAAFLYTFAAAALLGEVISIWIRAADKEAFQRTMRWLLSTAAVSGLAAFAATGAVFTAVHPTDTSGRLWHQLGGWGWATLFLLVGGGFIWGVVVSKPKRVWMALGLMGLIVVDLWSFGSKLTRLSPMTPASFWTDAQQILAADAVGRVLPWGISIFDQNGAAQVGLDSVFGYNPLEIGANTAFAASVPDPRSSAYDILAASHVVSQVPLPQYESGERPLRLLGQQNNTFVYQRGRSLPVARLVHDIEIIEAEADIIARIHAPDFDVQQTAILAQEPPCALDPSSTSVGTAVIQNQSDGHWQIATESPAPGLLILSETAYPGWQVTVDGMEQEPLVAYSAVRAVCVPMGQHLVEWTYQPDVFWQGGLVSLLALGLLGLAFYQGSGRPKMDSSR